MTVVFTTSALNGTDDSDGDTLTNQGVNFSPSVLSAAAGASQFKLTLLFGTSCPSGLAISDMWGGREASSGSLDYDGVGQAQVTVSGSTNISSTGAASLVVTDWITFGGGQTWDSTKGFVVRFFFPTGTSASYSVGGVTGTGFGFASSGTSNAGATTAGYSVSFAGTDILITKIEVQTASASAPIGKIFQVNQAIKRASYI